ncbi:MAG: transposase [Anaerolineales bacterium]
MPEAKIRLEVTIPLEEISVNALIVLFKEILVQLVPQMVTVWLEAYQEVRLNHRLGPRWSNEPKGEAGWSCPRCGSQEGFNRRGSRTRVLRCTALLVRKTSLGRIEFQLYQVTCCQCEKTFAPFAKEIMLLPYQVSTPEFKARSVETACQLSYQRSANMVSRGTLTSSVSATAIHSWVQEAGKDVSFKPRQAEEHTTLLDSTRVKASERERGAAALHLGFALTGRSTEGSRPRLDKQPVAFGVAESWEKVLAPLEGIQPERVVFDGDKGVEKQVETQWPKARKQRCLWHLIHQLYYHLWKDGLKKEESDPIRSRLKHLLYEKQEIDQAQEAYQKLVDVLCRADPSVTIMIEQLLSII